MQLTEVPHLNPGCCFICSSRNEGKWVDTLMTFEPGGPTPLNGRKYVCEGCASEMARLLGFQRGNDVELAISARDAAVAELQRLQQRVHDFAEALDSEVLESDVSAEPVVNAETSRPVRRRKKAAS